MERQRKFKRLPGQFGGSLLVALIGMVLVWFPVGDGLRDLSYDLPFLLRADLRVSNVVIVTIDRETQARLREPGGRKLHAQVLQRLTREGAALVFYDIIFEAPQPEADAVFAQAIKEHGRVVLAGTTEKTRQQSGDSPVAENIVAKPSTEELVRAARGFGLAQLPQFDAREIFLGDPDHVAAVWVAVDLARDAGAAALTDRLARRWINYYGPAGEPFDQIDFDRVLDPGGVPTNLFRAATVFVGGKPTDLSSRCESDVFGTPYSRFRHRFSPGVELLATEFANLRKGEWLESFADEKQLVIVGLFGVLAAVGLLQLRPWHAAWVALVAMLVVTAAALRLQIYDRLWWSWLVPVAVQTPMALVWSIGYQYAFESRKARQLRKAFAAYLSPEMAVEIAQSDVDVALGGKEVEATILFTDLEGFSTMAETLPPGDVSRILIAYFNRTTRHILERHGMISKYIGDAVMAIWGAPLANAEHAEQAVLAACGIREASQTEVEGRRLRTRIGINTGLTLAGNLGSEFRFDYTAIGATTNLAQRLENANQFLGTDILIADATRQKLSDAIRVRRLGRFLVKGIRQPALIYEVLGTVENFPNAPGWVAPFEQGVDLFTKRELAQAEALFRTVLALRDGQDGPAQFYLTQMAALRPLQPDDPWDGVLKLGV